MAKKNSYITVELDWAESQLATWKAYIDANPIHTLKDRVEMKPTARGGMIPMVIASIEQQGKFIQDTLDKYLRLLEVVDNLREKEAQKEIQTRANSQVNGVMRNFLSNKDENAE